MVQVATEAMAYRAVVVVTSGIVRVIMLVPLIIMMMVSMTIVMEAMKAPSTSVAEALEVREKA